MEKKYIFTPQDSHFLDIGIIICLLIDFIPSGMMIYGFITSSLSFPVFIVLLFLSSPLFCFACKHLYYRWLMFQFDKNSTLTIDTEDRTITYKYEEYGTTNKTVSFKVDDIDKWWKFDSGYMTVFIEEPMEFRLKDGKKVVISCVFKKAVDFIYSYKKELGLPEEYLAEGQSGRSRSFKAYIEKLEQLV